MLEKIHTAGAPAAIGPYSQAVREPRTGLVFCSGQIGLDPATGQLVPGGCEAECRRVFENIRAVLTAAGGSLADVTRTVLLLADMNDFPAVNAIYAEYFSEPFPARSTLQASGLPKGARIEVEATAIIG